MFSRKFRQSIGFKLFMNFAVILLLLAPVFGMVVITYQERSMTDSLIKEGKVISILLSGSMKTWIFAENAEGIRESLKDVISYPNIDSISVFNSRGEAICREQKNQVQEPGRRQAVEALGQLTYAQSEGGFFHVISGEETINVTCPVRMDAPVSVGEDLYFDNAGGRAKEITIGYLRVGISKAALVREERMILFRVAAATLLGIIAGLMVAFLTIRRVTMPLTDLTDQVRRFGSGEVVEKVPVNSDDEIGRLADAFNAMSENLLRREEEKTALMDRLRQSEKLESVGRLARGIAHDFNNILSTVQGSVYLLEKKFGDNYKVMQYVAQIQNSLSRARDLIQSIIIFSKAKEMKSLPVELNGVVRRLTPLLRNMAGDGITLEVSLAEEDLVVVGDIVQLEQVVMNLAVNAKDAMSGGGTLRVSTYRGPGESGAGTWRAPAAGFAFIQVSDTGTGIEDEIRAKIFEPFFTTKEMEKGTGLGLSIVYGIVEQHKGHVSVISAPGQGTTFKVAFPLFEKAGSSLDNIG